MSRDSIRVGVVGAGNNTVRRHIPELLAIEDVEVVSVCNRSRESSERVAAKFEIPKIYDHWSELIAADDTNAIVIGTWPYLHCATVLRALAAGKHVLTEARMAMNAFEARQMRDAARSHPELVSQIVPAPMTLWADNTIKRLLAEGYVGDILSVEVRQSGAFLDRDAPLHWRQDASLSGMNIMSLGIWYETMMRWVGEAVRVVAMGRTFTKLRRDPASGLMRTTRVPEHVEVLMDLACGAQGHMMISSVQGLSGADQASVYGSDGTLRIEGGALHGAPRGAEALAHIPIPSVEAASWRVEREFVNAVRGREKITLTSFDTGVKYMEFTEAVNLSLHEGKAVTLPL